MRIIKLLTVGLVIASATPVFADSYQEVAIVDEEEINLQVTEPLAPEPVVLEPDYNDHDGYDTFVEVVFLRPLGIATTVVGTGLFIGLSPLTAIATIAPPHDAFKWMADGLIVRPAKYTFTRPLGDFTYSTEYRAN